LRSHISFNTFVQSAILITVYGRLNGMQLLTFLLWPSI